jgi:PQQ-dependent catabolism-associated CXXCW motif protein
MVRCVMIRLLRRFSARFIARLAVAAVLTAAGGQAQAADLRPGSDIPLPLGYRSEPYRAPTPAYAPGAVTVNTDEAEALHKAGATLFIDVMRVPQSEMPGLAGKWLVAQPHAVIPGSVWLPKVGEGDLTPDLERYFRTNLERLTHGDRSAAILFYCIADCWMSWNAAKRAASWGFGRVLWYRDGIDGWRDYDLPIETADPVPIAGSVP